jgi:hypothetical protein
MTDLIKQNMMMWMMLLGLALAGTAAAQEETDREGNRIKIDYELIFPDEKAPLNVKPEEENPFVAMADLNAKPDAGNSEENVVKERLLAMQVVGASPRAKGYRVQLGDMILEAGMVVPPFLPDQSVQLRVNGITEQEIEFVWLEKQRTGLPPRTLLMPIKIRPVVRYALPGQPKAEDGKEQVMGVREEGLIRALPTTADVGQPKRGEVVEDTVAEEASAGAGKVKTAARPKSSGDAVLDMFFNQGGILPPTR